MNLKKIFIIPILVVLYSGCSSKEDFYRGAYNFVQDDSFCTNAQECRKKELQKNDYNYHQNTKKSYDEYKDTVSTK